MKNLKKRCGISMLMGASFGLLCFMGFSSNPDIPVEIAKFQEWSWSNPMMWSTIVNRFMIGFTVGLVGFVTVHPFFGFKIPVFARGFNTGALVSLPLALGALMGESPEMATKSFWIVLIAGAMIGMIIDLVATRIAGQGEELHN
jgi:hypothetical protein